MAENAHVESQNPFVKPPVVRFPETRENPTKPSSALPEARPPLEKAGAQEGSGLGVARAARV